MPAGGQRKPWLAGTALGTNPCLGNAVIRLVLGKCDSVIFPRDMPNQSGHRVTDKWVFVKFVPMNVGICEFRHEEKSSSV